MWPCQGRRKPIEVWGARECPRGAAPCALYQTSFSRFGPVGRCRAKLRVVCFANAVAKRMSYFVAARRTMGRFDPLAVQQRDHLNHDMPSKAG